MVWENIYSAKDVSRGIRRNRTSSASRELEGISEIGHLRRRGNWRELQKLDWMCGRGGGGGGGGGRGEGWGGDLTPFGLTVNQTVTSSSSHSSRSYSSYISYSSYSSSITAGLSLPRFVQAVWQRVRRAKRGRSFNYMAKRRAAHPLPDRLHETREISPLLLNRVTHVSGIRFR